MKPIDINHPTEFIKELFFKNIERQGECWIWTGYARPERQYPLFLIDNKFYPANRISLLLHGEELPNRIFNLCGNKLCVNPDHLSKKTKKPRPKKKITTAQIRELLNLSTHSDLPLEEIAEITGINPRQIGKILHGNLRLKQFREIVNEPGYRPRLPGYYTTGEAIAKTGLTNVELRRRSVTERWEIYSVAHTVLYKTGDIDRFISQPDSLKEA